MTSSAPDSLETSAPQLALTEIQRRIEAACTRAGRDAASVTLIGASKNVAAPRLSKYFEAGLKHVGENYVPEGQSKIERLKNEAVTWHLIGALQRNKASAAVRDFDWIHSVDRLSLARAIDNAARGIGKVQPILLQVNLGEESSKGGCAPRNLLDLWRECAELPQLSVRGLMALPPMSVDAEASRPYFQRLRELRDELRGEEKGVQSTLSELSMGMSNDFEIAVEEGATFVRVGTALFGSRVEIVGAGGK